MDWMWRKRRPLNEENHQLETDEEYQERWLSVKIIYFTMFLMSLGFSIVLTGVWPYLDKLDPNAGKVFMGFVVAANPLGQMIFSPIFGWWGNKIKSVRLPMYLSIAIFGVASLLYSFLELFPYPAYWMLFSRFLVGVGSANVTLCRSYLSSATKLKERTDAVSMVSLAQVLGFIVGPAFQAAMTPLGETGVALVPGKIYLNMYTTVGWVNAILALANFFLFFPFIFKERPIAAREVMVVQGKSSEKEAWKGIKPDYLSAWTLIAAFFVLVFNFVLLETIGTSLTMDQFAFSKEEALKFMGILMSVGAIIACITFVAIGPLCKRFEERLVLLWGGFFMMVLGRALYIPLPGDLAVIAYPEIRNTTFLNDTEITNFTTSVGCPISQEWCLTTPALTMTQFLLGYFFTSIGYPIGVTLIQTIFSKILGPRPQGVWMGMITGSGCFSRIMGPVCVGIVYTKYGTYATFGFTTVMMIMAMIWLWFFRDRLVPPQIEKPGEEMVVLGVQPNNKENPTERDGLSDGLS